MHAEPGPCSKGSGTVILTLSEFRLRPLKAEIDLKQTHNSHSRPGDQSALDLGPWFPDLPSVRVARQTFKVYTTSNIRSASVW